MLDMQETLRIVYYGALDPRSGIKAVVKRYALYFNEMHVVNGLKLLQIYEREYRDFEHFDLAIQRCKKVMDDLRDFSQTTGFAINFYDPLEISNSQLWKMVEQATERDLQTDLRKEAVDAFKSEDIAAGMITGVNIALAKSIELTSAPITNETYLHDLAMKKFDVALEDIKNSHPYLKDSFRELFHSNYNFANLYGFDIFKRLDLPVADLSDEAIAELRKTNRFEKFRTNLQKRAYDCVEKATSLLERDKKVTEQVAEFEAECRQYEKAVKEDVPKMRRDFLKNVTRDSIAVGFLTSLAFGLPIGLLCFGITSSSEYFATYYKAKKDLLKKYDSCCAFLFDLREGKLNKPGNQMPDEIFQMPGLDVNIPQGSFGALASKAALYFWTQ
jgi:hypothetical protein